MTTDAIELLSSAYAAFNKRDIDGALSVMQPDVEWANGMEGGFVYGHEAVRAYWTRQWQAIDPYVEPISFKEEPAGHVAVVVHQVVRDLSGRIVVDRRVTHRYSMRDGRVSRMEIED